jgi:hypothetical protein
LAHDTHAVALCHDVHDVLSLFISPSTVASSHQRGWIGFIGAWHGIASGRGDRVW